MRRKVKAFKGSIEPSPPGWYIHFTDYVASSDWMTLSEAKKLAEDILKACAKIEKAIKK
jgi:hypothetical protein